MLDCPMTFCEHCILHFAFWCYVQGPMNPPPPSLCQHAFSQCLSPLCWIGLFTLKWKCSCHQKFPQLGIGNILIAWSPGIVVSNLCNLTARVYYYQGQNLENLGFQPIFKPQFQTPVFLALPNLSSNSNQSFSSH